MKVAHVKAKDTDRLIKKLDGLIGEHRAYFAAWRSNRWSEFEKANIERRQKSEADERKKKD